MKNLFVFSILVCVSVFAETDQTPEKPFELPRSEVFPPEDGMPVLLKGKIINRRYYAPKNVFSCAAHDFGEGQYLVQDSLRERIATVGFYNSIANFKKAELLFIPELEKKKLGQKAFKDAFNYFGIEILKTVDHAQGIEILREEMVAENMFFVAISVEKMSVLRTSMGEYMSSTRGYLVFQDKDKLVILSNQETTFPGEEHTPKKHIEKLKKDILSFRKTFEFGRIPESVIQKAEMTGS
jgi:hypothetical protein